MTKRARLALTDDETLDGKMEKLATQMADDLIGGAKIERQKVEAFAKLTSYFTATRKLTGGEDELPKAGFSFGAAKARMGRSASGQKTETTQ